MRQGILEFKLVVSKAQAQNFDEAIRTTKFLRNKGIRLWRSIKGTKRKDIQKLSSVLAKERSFVAKLNAMARQASLERAWSSISRFYANCKKKKKGSKGYPQYKKDVRSVEYKTTGWKLAEDYRSITFTDGHNIGLVKMRNTLSKDSHYNLSNYSKENIKRVRVIKRADGYYVQFVIKDIQHSFQKQRTNKAIAFDVGVKDYITDQDGNTVACTKWLERGEKKLKRLQRQLSKKKKGSQNRKKAKIKLAKYHLSISRKRKDFVIKLARTLHQSNDWIICEDLNIAKMIKAGRCSKSLSDASLGLFFQWLDYYEKLGGAEVLKVSAAYTTSQCHNCNDILSKKLSERWHQCLKCGCSLPRDHNSALVILKRGLKELLNKAQTNQILGAVGNTDSLYSLNLDSENQKSLVDLEPLVSIVKALDIKPQGRSKNLQALATESFKLVK